MLIQNLNSKISNGDNFIVILWKKDCVCVCVCQQLHEKLSFMQIYEILENIYSS